MNHVCRLHEQSSRNAFVIETYLHNVAAPLRENLSHGDSHSSLPSLRVFLMKYWCLFPVFPLISSPLSSCRSFSCPSVSFSLSRHPFAPHPSSLALSLSLQTDSRVETQHDIAESRTLISSRNAAVIIATTAAPHASNEHVCIYITKHIHVYVFVQVYVWSRCYDLYVHV